MVSESIMERIRKIATLASRAGTDGEAQAATLALQRLLTKHGMSVDDIEDAPEEKKVAHVEADFISGYTLHWKQMLAEIIAENFRCSYYWNKIPNDNRRYDYFLFFMGLAEDAEIAAAAYRMTEKAIKRLAKKHLRQRKDAQGYSFEVSEAMDIRNSYIGGFIVGLREALAKQVEETAMVLARDVLVEQELESMDLITRMTRRQTNFQSDLEAMAAGVKDGRKHGETQKEAKDND